MTSHDSDETVGAVAAPTVVLPDGKLLFANRSLRFAQLARTHAMGDFLSFMARLAQVQHQVLHARPPPGLPAGGRTAYAAPPLAVAPLIHQFAWQEDFTDLVGALRQDAEGAPAAVLARAVALDSAMRKRLAEVLLAGKFEEQELDDRGVLPLIGAALQVYWVRLTGALSAAKFADVEPGVTCPICGFHPVASVLHTGGERSNLRYLHCALCSNEWRMIRIKCSVCESLNHIQYFNLTGATQPYHAAVRAETCDDCRSYLKIIDRNKDPAADPYADDLATLVLDVLLDEAGYQRSGSNLLFVSGTGET
jgi:FdhE protein